MASKHAESIGSAAPDPIAGQASVQPVPQVAISNKPAPGQTGPRGLGPRQTYSRVNTGIPPVPEAGLNMQKNGPNLGLNTLPKLSEVRMTDMVLPHTDLNTLLKHAMEGTASRVKIAAEASLQLRRQHGGEPAQTKTASATAPHYATEQIQKLASAMEYVASELEKTAEPGEGPGALTVTQTNTSGESLQPGQSGQATSGNQPPKNPGFQADQTPGAASSTGLETNDDMQHGEQPVEPIPNETASLENDKSKTAADLAVVNLRHLTAKLAGKDSPEGHHLRRALLGNPTSAAIEARKGEKTKAFGEALGHGMVEYGKGALGGGAAGAAAGASIAGSLRGRKSIGRGALVGGLYGSALGSIAGSIKGSHGAEASRIHGARSKHKEASIFDLLRSKQAEDAINPAQISSGTAPDANTSPTGATPSGEGSVPVPSDVSSQANMIGSNEAAINYTKGQAKADPKKDLKHVLNEPALSASTDKVLNQAFANTSAAGAKIASVREHAVSTAAARVLLNKLQQGA